MTPAKICCKIVEANVDVLGTYGGLESSVVKGNILRRVTATRTLKKVDEANIC